MTLTCSNPVLTPTSIRFYNGTTAGTAQTYNGDIQGFYLQFLAPPFYEGLNDQADSDEINFGISATNGYKYYIKLKCHNSN